MAKFNLMNMMNDQSKAENKNAMETIELDIADIEADPNNDFEVEGGTEIEEKNAWLKDSIENDGLLSPVTVRKSGEKYKIISGHRRFLAYNRLAEEGKEQFQKVPCIVMTLDDELKAERLLIEANMTTREVSTWEKAQSVKRMNRIFDEYEKSGQKFEGRRREHIAKALGMSTSTVGRLENINNNLVPEYQEELKQGNISASVADKIASQPEEEQKELHEAKGAAVKTTDLPKREPKEISVIQEDDRTINEIIKFPKTYKGMHLNLKADKCENNTFYMHYYWQTNNGGGGSHLNVYFRTYAEGRMSVINEVANLNKEFAEAFLKMGFISKLPDKWEELVEDNSYYVKQTNKGSLRVIIYKKGSLYYTGYKGVIYGAADNGEDVEVSGIDKEHGYYNNPSAIDGAREMIARDEKANELMNGHTLDDEAPTDTKQESTGHWERINEEYQKKAVIRVTKMLQKKSAFFAGISESNLQANKVPEGLENEAIAALFEKIAEDIEIFLD